MPKSAAPQDCFPRQAALVSLLTPIAAVCASFFSLAFMLSQPAEYKVWTHLIMDAVAATICLIGLIFGILALSGLKQYTAQGLLGRALSGTLLNGIIVAAALVLVPTCIQKKNEAEQARKSLLEVQAASRKMQDMASKDLRNGTNSTRTEEQMAELQKTMQDAAQKMSGSDALAMQASSAYLEKLNELKKAYDGAATELKAAKILVPSSVKQKEDFKSRREITRNFLDVNAKLSKFVAEGEQNYRAEFARLKVPQRVTEQAVVGYRKKADLVNPLVVRIRRTDEVVGTNLMAIIDLEEAHWGHWSASSANGKVRFEDEALAQEYNNYLQQIRDAAAEQGRLQQQLLTVTSSTEN